MVQDLHNTVLELLKNLVLLHVIVKLPGHTGCLLHHVYVNIKPSQQRYFIILAH